MARAPASPATPPAIAPVNKRAALVREQTASSLRAALVAGRYPPGERLIERELCAALGISRPTLREALRQLEAEKLVLVEPHRGPTVAGISADQAREIYEVRALLEPKAMEGFIRRASAAEFAALEDACRQFEEAASKHDLVGLIETTERYYRVLLSGAGNECLRDIIEGMMARISYLRARSMSNRGRLPGSIADMRAMTAAIKKRDVALARQVCVEHIKAASEAAIRQIGFEAPAANGTSADARTNGARRPNAARDLHRQTRARAGG